MNKRSSIANTLLVIFLSLTFTTYGKVYAENPIYTKPKFHSNIQNNIYKFLINAENRKTAFDAALALNNGKQENCCVYFASEVLRRNNLKIPTGVNNTSQLIKTLKQNNWKVEKDYKKLQPGDICFTTPSTYSKKNLPSHTYIFMNWVTKDNYDYAYICDNQAQYYDDSIYHKRNITIKDVVNGSTKDPFSFFMYAQ